MSLTRLGLALLVVGELALASACANRSAPYRFRSGLVGGVHAPPLDRFAGTTESSAPSRSAVQPRSSDVSDTSKASSMIRKPTHKTTRRTQNASASPPNTPPKTSRRPFHPSLPSLAMGSRKPLRPEQNHDSSQVGRNNRNKASGPVSLADILRGAVGRRDKKSTHTGFALATLKTLGLSIASDRELRAIHRGVELAALAKKRSAISHSHTALLGDLVVFNGVVDTLPASLIGVVISQRPTDGTIEFVYLARGVVRRGWVNPSKPNDKRSATGHILNTFVRHSNGHDRSGTRYLAGHLFAYVVRLDRLLN